MAQNAITMKNNTYVNTNLVQIKQEQLNGIVYDMSPTSPHFRHTQIAQNVMSIIRNTLYGKKCKVYMYGIDLMCHPHCEDEAKRTDYVIPDVVIVCDQSLFKGGQYYGVPPFVLEILSPSTKKRDRMEKLKVYEEMGVSEYWIINVIGVLDIYYLENGSYELHDTFTLCRDKNEDEYNETQDITLREFPDITMTLGEIFN